MHRMALSLPSLIVGLALGAPALAETPDAICEGVTPLYEIQGATHVSPYVGQTVTTCGVVTAVGFNFFYIQDPVGDGDDATSDGMYVFNSRPPVSVGELVRLQDTVEERIPGGASTGNLSTTQFSFPAILDRTTGVVPAPVVIGRGGRVPPAVQVIGEAELPVNLQDAADAAVTPFNPTVDGIDFYESLEGMLVTVEQPVAVSATRQFGSFSAEVFTLANNGADAAPANARNGRGGILLQPDLDNRGDQNPERVQIQFDGRFSFPAIKVGDRLSDVTGPVGYSFGNFEVLALDAPTVSDGGNQQEDADIEGPGLLRVAAYNVLNLSAVSGDDDQRDEIARQIATHLHAPDIIALQEIQDNNGDAGDCPSNDASACSGELDATLTLQALVDAIVAAGGPEYSFFDVAPLVETEDETREDGATPNPDNFGGAEFSNIRNAFLYDASRVDLVSYTGLTRDVLAARGVSVPNAFDFSRDPLEGVFRFQGEIVTLLNNHFSSRFGSTPVFGGPQPFVQAAEDARRAQSQAMHDLTQRLLDSDPTANIVVLGDLNTFEFTDELAETLPGTGDAQVLFNLVDRNQDDNAYSFIFEGNGQALDHVFVSESLRTGARLDFVHVNNDFPRLFSTTVGSDHEPIVAGLDVARTCVLGEQSVRFADRSQTGDRVGTFGTANIGADAFTGTIVADGTVQLRSRATVDGDVFATGGVHRQAGAVVEGVTQGFLPAVSLPAIEAVHGPDSGRSNIIVNAGQTVSIPPGSYGRLIVNSRGTLVLETSGDYAFSSVIVNAKGEVHYAEDADLYVGRNLTYRGDQHGVGPLDVFLQGRGTARLENSFDGSVVGPEASVFLMGNGGPVFTGARYVGRVVQVGSDVTVDCD